MAKAYRRELTVGVTGHLRLNASARTRVARQAICDLEPVLRDCGIHGLRILSGLAPGADLVLTHALIKLARTMKLRCQLSALLVAPPDEIIQHWLERAAQLGEEPSANSRSEVRKIMDLLLAEASETVDISRTEGSGHSAFQTLAARLALESDLLLAVLRPDHQGQPGGTAEVVAWRRDPQRIPGPLRARLLPQVSRRLLVIDPDAADELTAGVAGTGG